MTRIVSLAHRVGGWKGTTLLLVDHDTGQHYVISTIHSPWSTRPESLVYPTGSTGSVRSVPGWGTGRLHFVAGGPGMTQIQALHDLTLRLETDTLLTEEESAKIEQAMLDEEIEAFGRYTARRAEPTTG